jgi:hypothetical protein
MILGIENVSLAHIVKNPWLDKDLRQGMTNLTVRIVLENFSQSVALPAPNLLQEKVVLEIPNSLLLKNLLGIMSASFVQCAKNQWLAKDSFKMKAT